MSQIPDQIKRARAIRKPTELPDSAQNAYLDDETKAWLDTLHVYAVDGKNLWEEEFSTKERYYILWDYTTNLAWLADSAGFNYPRYVINVNPWRPEEFLSRPENMPESVSIINRLLEADDEYDMHSSPRTRQDSLGGVPSGKIDPKAIKTLIGEVSSWQERNPYPDYGILWVNQSTGKVIYTVGDGQEGDLDDLEDIVLRIPGVTDFELADEWSPSDKDGFIKVWKQNEKVTEMTSSISLGTAPISPKKNRKKDRGIIVQSAELIGNLLSEANESENLEKNKFEVVCLDASGKETSTKSFTNEEDAQSYIEKKNEKLDDDEVGCSYKIRVVAKEHKDQFAIKEARNRIKIGSRVRGIMGIEGGKVGVVTKIGAPYSNSSKSPTVVVKSDDGKEWDTFAFNLSLLESNRKDSKLTECQHGDIVRLTGYLRRPGFWRVDTEDAVGASQERPWVEDVDSGTGFYVDPSDTDDMELVLSSSEFETRLIQSSDDVQEMLDDEDEDWED